MVLQLYKFYLMKIKHAVVFIILGYCITLYGSLQKILHTPNADKVLTVATGITIFGFLMLLYKLFTSAKFKEFMDS
jgi:mannose/fructose/N-acetylgalactosamine-specific phosphotransferase system component IIC